MLMPDVTIASGLLKLADEAIRRMKTLNPPVWAVESAAFEIPLLTKTKFEITYSHILDMECEQEQYRALIDLLKEMKSAITKLMSTEEYNETDAKTILPYKRSVREIFTPLYRFDKYGTLPTGYLHTGLKEACEAMRQANARAKSPTLSEVVVLAAVFDKLINTNKKDDKVISKMQFIYLSSILGSGSSFSQMFDAAKKEKKEELDFGEFCTLMAANPWLLQKTITNHGARNKLTKGQHERAQKIWNDHSGTINVRALPEVLAALGYKVKADAQKIMETYDYNGSKDLVPDEFIHMITMMVAYNAVDEAFLMS